MKHDIRARIQTALTQDYRRNPNNVMSAEDAMRFLEKIVENGDPESYSRSRLVEIGKFVMRHGVRVIAPACPDYTHHRGTYTFHGVRGGTSLLAQLQIEFLQQLGIEDVTIIYADVERFDAAIRDRFQIGEDAFLELIRQSRADTAIRIPSSWNVMLMSDLLPTMRENADARMVCMLDDPAVHQRLVNETHTRVEMYRHIVPRATFDDMLVRTARTAAQYCELGDFATKNGYVISNHVTTNLAWYDSVNAVVLRNPVRIY